MNSLPEEPYNLDPNYYDDSSDSDEDTIFYKDYTRHLYNNIYNIKVDKRHIDFYDSKVCIAQFLYRMFVVERFLYGDEPYQTRINIKLTKAKLNIFLYYRKLKPTKYYFEFIKMDLPYEINTKIIDLCMK